MKKKTKTLSMLDEDGLGIISWKDAMLPDATNLKNAPNCDDVILAIKDFDHITHEIL